MVSSGTTLTHLSMQGTENNVETSKEFLFQSSVTVLILDNAVLKYMEMCGTSSSV